ncbi:MAG: thioredoxin family protein [Candidatus Kapabacteria bacterium]|nr:thioredoxin family protein [Candidatus Kapabacteria bacterium]
MLDIKVLGTGCSKCIKLEENVRFAVNDMAVEANVEKITDLNQIMSYGIMMTPGLVINGKVVSFGRVLNSKDITELIKKA